MRELVHVPDSPPFVAGLTEVRDKAVPVIDLRRKLGLPQAEITHQTRILVLEVPVEARTLLVGLVADRVIEVISLATAQIGPPPDTGSGRGSGYISGIARHADGFVIVFDLARLLSGDATLHLAAATGSAVPISQAA
jgi:purine-binding chemotaxis protein CheW